MLKTSFGKLAIGVVVFSSSMIAHAEGSIFNGSSVAFESNNPWGSTPFLSGNAALNFVSPDFTSFGPINIKVFTSADYISVNWTDKDTSENKASPSSSTEKKAPKKSRENRVTLHAGPKFEHKFTSDIGIFCGAGIGVASSTESPPSDISFSGNVYGGAALKLVHWFPTVTVSYKSVFSSGYIPNHGLVFGIKGTK